MTYFYVEFKNQIETLTLKFEIHDHITAKKWYQELTEQLQRNPKLKENNRLYHFPGDSWSLEKITSELKNLATIINTHKFYIPEVDQIDTSIDQPLLNTLHKYFEDMRGGILNPGEYFTKSPEHIKRTIEDYNVLIHRTEDKLNAKRDRPRMVLTFQNRRRHELMDSDYDNFSLDINFGEVYVNYCEVGKSLWDVFKDKDTIVGDENIRPLKWYSADMMIYFMNGSYRTKIQKFWHWWDTQSEFLSELGFIKYDKRLSIGHIPVAKLVTDRDPEEIVLAIAKFDKINRVYI